MADKIPLKGLFDGSGNVTGLAEFRSADGDTVGVSLGGTGLATVGTNRILTGNGTGDLTDEANLTFDGTTLDVTGNITLSGNLTVQGNFEETVKIATEDPIIALNTAIASNANNTKDAGFVIERGQEANVALIWDESDSGTSGGIFNFITTTDTGIVSGDINVSGQVIDGILVDAAGATSAFTSTTASETKLVTEAAVKTHVSAQASAFAIALG